MNGVRPNSISWFERLSLLSLALIVPHDYLTWDELIAGTSDIALDPILVILITQGITLAVSLFLIFMVSLGRSRTFKWIWTVLAALGLVITIAELPSDFAAEPIVAAIFALQSVLTVLAAGFLFRPDAKAWLAGRDPIDLEAFR